MGAFGVYSSETDPGRFAESDWDKKVLTFLAHYAVLAIQNENRQQALRSAQEQRSVAETFAAVGDIASNLLHHLNNKVGTIPVRVQSIQDKCAPALECGRHILPITWLRLNAVPWKPCRRYAIICPTCGQFVLNRFVLKPG